MPRSAPAVLPVAAFIAGVAMANGLQQRPIALFALLAGLGLALGGLCGGTVAASAAGMLLGVLSLRAPLDLARDLVTEVEGEVCGFWRERPEFSRRSARLCVDWLRQGRTVLVRPNDLWLEMPGGSKSSLALGERIVARGSLARFAGLANEDQVPPGPARLSVKSLRHVRSVARPAAIARLAQRVRFAVERSIRDGSRKATGSPGDGSAMLRAFLLGDEGGLSEGRRRALRRTGLAHLLAVSGFNVTLIAASAALLVGGVASRWRLLVPLVAMLGYLMAVGPDPSILRATAMAVAMIAALALRRAGSSLQAISLVAATLVAWNPRVLGEAGFQLSFGATATLILFATRWRRRLERLPRPLAIGLASTVAAQVGTLPTTFAIFREAVPAAALWNLLYLPWATLCLYLQLLWIALAGVASGTAAALVPMLDLLSVPFAWLELLPPSSWGSISTIGGARAGLVVMVSIVAAIELRPFRLCVLGLLVGLIGHSRQLRPAGDAEVVFLDVGQGDAAIVRSGETSVLIDGGGMRGRDLGAIALRPALRRAGIKTVTVVVISHADQDHCLGLVDLSVHQRLGELWISRDAADSACVRALRPRLERPPRVLSAPLEGTWGAIGWRALHPALDAGGSGNRQSIVLRLEVAGRTLLFTGDLPAEQEHRLAAMQPDQLRADLLKVAHHGSASSSSMMFLMAVQPRLAIISAGFGNRFDHPSAQVVQRLEATGARILRTDRDGQIRVRWRRGGPWHIDTPGAPRPGRVRG